MMGMRGTVKRLLWPVVLGSLWVTGAVGDDRGAAWEALQGELPLLGQNEGPPPDWASASPLAALQPAGGPALTNYRRALVSRGWDGPPVWHRAGFLASGRHRLGVNLFVPPGRVAGVFLFVHGYQSHAAAYGALLSAVARQGWMVVTLDLPGHGFSEGPRSDIRDFSEYGDAVADWLRWVNGQDGWPQKTVLAAHSLGTAACLEALTRPTTPVPSRVWFFAPLLRPAWFPVLAWAQDVVGGALTEVGSPFATDGYLDGATTPVHWLTALRGWLPRIEAHPPLALPLTLWSGDRDTVVDAEWNRQVYQRLVPGVDYRVLRGHDHLFLTDPGQRSVVADVVRELVALGCPPAPSQPPGLR